MTNRLVLAVTLLGACQLRLNGRPVGARSDPQQPQSQQSQTTGAPVAEPAVVAPTRKAKSRAPAFDEQQFNNCIATFDANYDAWLPQDKEAKAALAKAAGKSPYVAMPILLAALDKIDDYSTQRQTGGFKPGSYYARVSRVQLATAMVELAARTHAASCVNNQHQLEIDHEYLPPLTGDRAKDKVIQCGGPSEEARLTWYDARKAMADGFNTPNRQLHDDHSKGGSWSKVLAFAQTGKEATLTLTTMSGNRRCVANGRYGRLGDGSWGQLCDWEELPAFSIGDSKVYHFAPQELPFKLQKGDEVSLAYELDPDAPATSDKVSKKGGWWWLGSVRHGKANVFEDCATAKAHQAEVRSVLAPLQVMSRKD